MGRCCKNLAERKEEEVLVKYKVEESKRGRSAPLEWREVRKDRKYRIIRWKEDCWARILSLFRETTGSVCKASRRCQRK